MVKTFAVQISIFIYFFKYETIETYVLAFLSHNNPSVARVIHKWFIELKIENYEILSVEMLIWQFQFDTSGEDRQLYPDQTIDCPFFNKNKSQKTQEKPYYISRFFSRLSILI